MPSYVVERIVFGDGEKAKNGATLERNIWYASSVLYGGPESIFAIVQSSRAATAQSTVMQEHLTVPVSKPSLHKEWVRIMFKIATEESDKKKDTNAKEAVWASAKSKPGHAIIIGGPGDRPVDAGAAKYWEIDDGEICYSDNSGACVDASIVNAVSCLRPFRIAEQMKKIMIDANNT